MKKFNTFICGFLFASILSAFAVPVMGAAIDAAFNSVNLEVDGKVVAQKGQSYTLPNGKEVPYSINYEGTTYLPVRKIGEVFNKPIDWDATTGTAIVGEKKPEVDPNEKPLSEMNYEEFKQVFPLVREFGGTVDAKLHTYDFEYKGNLSKEKFIQEFSKIIENKKAEGYCLKLFEEYSKKDTSHPTAIGLFNKYIGEDGRIAIVIKYYDNIQCDFESFFKIIQK